MNLLIIVVCLVSSAVAAAPTAEASPVVRSTDVMVSVRGTRYELRISKTAGVFDYLIDNGAGAFVSVMRPNGEKGWYGYNGANGDNGASSTAKPVVQVRTHARGVTVTVKCALSASIRHTAIYDCLDDCVVVANRYDGKASTGGIGLIRTGPKMDVDINRFDSYLYFDDSGNRHAGNLTGKPRDFYAGIRCWEGVETAPEFDKARPYMALSGPGGSFAVAYPFVREQWRRQPRFIQLYKDGGNYWYTGAGSESGLNRDYVVCLIGGGATDETQLKTMVDTALAKARQAVAAGDIPIKLTKMKGPDDGTLYLMSYDHAVGYPKIQEETRRTIALIDANPDLRMGLQAEGYTWDWLSQNDPAFIKDIHSWIAGYKGRWTPGGGSYGQPYFTFISEESGIRQMFYGTRAIKQHLGIDNRYYIYSEHETMPQLPQILAGMGYQGAIFRTHMNYGGDGPSRDADWVLWTGPDGSSIPAVPAYTGSEHALGNEWLVINYRPGIEWYHGIPFNWSDAEDFKSEMLTRGVSMPLVSRCEDWYTRPSKPLIEDARAHAVQKTQWVTVEDYFNILAKSGVKPIQMKAGPNDFQPRQPWGYTGNRTWTGGRAASSRALAAEGLSVAAIVNGMKWTPDRQKRLDDAWKNLLIAEHHDTLICAIYNEGRNFTEPSLKLSDDLAREAADYVSSRVKVKGRALFVFNPTAHARSEPIRFPDVPSGLHPVDATGRSIPCQRTGGDLWVVATNIPPLGYSVIRLTAGEPLTGLASSSERSLQTGRYSVRFGEHGGLESLHDVVNGRDIVRPGKPTGILKGVIDNSAEESKGSVAIAMNGPCVWQALETGAIGVVKYETTYTFSAGSPRIDLHIRLMVPKGARIGCPADKGTPESRRSGGQYFDGGVKLRYCLQTALNDTATAVRHQPLIISEMDGPAETIDANLWAGLEDGSLGLAIANRGSMGLHRSGSSLEPILAYSGEYVWGDNFLEGVYDYDFAVIPYDGKRDRAGAHKQAVEFDQPLYVFPFTGNGGTLPLTASVAPLPNSADAVTALALFPQDGRIFLRLCNMGTVPIKTNLPGAHYASLALKLGKPVVGATTLAPWRAQTYELTTTVKTSSVKPPGHM